MDCGGLGERVGWVWLFDAVKEGLRHAYHFRSFWGFSELETASGGLTRGGQDVGKGTRNGSACAVEGRPAQSARLRTWSL